MQMVQWVDAAPVPLTHPTLTRENMQCPICQHQVEEASPYALFNKNQYLRACSDDHLETLLAGLHEYLVPGEHQHAEHESKGSVCPLCGMEGAHTNALDFTGNQALFLCPMETQSSKEKLLSSPADYVSKKHMTKEEVYIVRIEDWLAVRPWQIQLWCHAQLSQLALIVLVPEVLRLCMSIDSTDRATCK